MSIASAAAAGGDTAPPPPAHRRRALARPGRSCADSAVSLTHSGGAPSAAGGVGGAMWNTPATFSVSGSPEDLPSTANGSNDHAQRRPRPPDATASGGARKRTASRGRRARGSSPGGVRAGGRGGAAERRRDRRCPVRPVGGASAALGGGSIFFDSPCTILWMSKRRGSMDVKEQGFGGGARRLRNAPPYSKTEEVKDDACLWGKGTRRFQLVRRDGRDVSTLYGREGGGGHAWSGRMIRVLAGVCPTASPSAAGSSPSPGSG